MSPIAISLRPLDLLFFRGGRPFTAGLPGYSTLPTPQALLGLVRTLLLERNGADFRAMRGIADPAAAFAAAGCPWLASVSVRGPFLRQPQHGLALPAPASLALNSEGRPHLFQPLDLAPPGWTPPFPDARPLHSREIRSKTGPQFLSQEGLALFLSGKPPLPEHLLNADGLFLHAERTGIGIDPKTLATEEGVIYTTHKLTLRPGVSFYAEIHGLPEDQRRFFPKDKETLSPWGGERHHVAISQVSPVQWPSAPAAAGGRSLAYLAAPCFDLAAGIPSALPPAAVRAAATVGPVSLSGWDLVKGGPKPARFGIGAGSVFFLENATLPASLSAPADSLAGYGFSLKGTWNYAQ